MLLPYVQILPYLLLRLGNIRWLCLGVSEFSLCFLTIRLWNVWMCFDLHYFISVFPSQFSALFCPEKLNYFLFFGSKATALLEKDVFFCCAFLLRPRGQPPWQVILWWHWSRLGSSRGAVINCRDREGMPGPSRPPSVPPRRSGLHHTQSACVRRHKPASKEEQTSAAKYHVLMLYVPGWKLCSTGLAFSLFILDCTATSEEVFCQEM